MMSAVSANAVQHSNRYSNLTVKWKSAQNVARIMSECVHKECAWPIYDSSQLK